MESTINYDAVAIEQFSKLQQLHRAQQQQDRWMTVEHVLSIVTVAACIACVLTAFLHHIISVPLLITMIVTNLSLWFSIWKYERFVKQERRLSKIIPRIVTKYEAIDDSLHINVWGHGNPIKDLLWSTSLPLDDEVALRAARRKIDQLEWQHEEAWENAVDRAYTIGQILGNPTETQVLSTSPQRQLM